jgi:ketol-acid reductoisomerase
MGFKRAADGVAAKGKTKGKNLGDSGPTVGIQSEKGSKSAKTVTSKAMKAVGRNMARANNQK